MATLPHSALSSEYPHSNGATMQTSPRSALTTSQRGYGARWKRLRKVKLAADPLCRMCAEQLRTTPARVVDHIVPHKGDPALLYDMDNLQSLCFTCHNAAKHSEEKTGRVRGAGADGVPLDARHHWRDR